jgi:aryl-alcohol dehydrogenase-like predicted oxidoreductase
MYEEVILDATPIQKDTFPMTPSIQARIPASETEFVDIPETQLKVSRVALGTWPLGGREGIDIPGSIATIRAALDQGINLIDTAPVYGFGLAERILGVALEGRRTQAVIATKTGLEWNDGKVYRNATRTRIMRELDDSLRRLRTDYIDIYQVQWPDPLTPVEETAEVMRMLYEQGRIRAIGVSNFSVAEIDRFRRVAPLHVVHSPYNLFERTAEAELLPYCQGNDIVTFGSSALCRGLLGGRMQPATTFKAGDLRCIDPKFQPPHFAQYHNAVRQLDEFAQRRFRRRVVHLAVRWMLDQGISVALLGSRHPAQVEAAFGVAGWSLNNTDRMLIEEILKTAIVEPVDPEFIPLTA